MVFDRVSVVRVVCVGCGEAAGAEDCDATAVGVCEGDVAFCGRADFRFESLFGDCELKNDESFENIAWEMSDN